VVEATDAEVFAKHAEELTRFATGIVGPADAQDVVSAAFVHCMVSRHWRQVANRRAYLYRAVLNESRGLRRGAARRSRRELASTLAETTVEAETPRPEVFAAVARLSLRQRGVVVLTYWDDLEPARVAELLGISEGSVRRHLARARAKLKEVLVAED
jgi:RNA polymerase sigma factor (sigma-70 family)